MRLTKFNRYKENLTQVGNKIFSYETHVATLDYKGNSGNRHNCLIQHGWWSVTTQRHVNYVANHYSLPIVEMDLGKYEAMDQNWFRDKNLLELIKT